MSLDTQRLDFVEAHALHGFPTLTHVVDVDVRPATSVVTKGEAVVVCLDETPRDHTASTVVLGKS